MQLKFSERKSIWGKQITAKEKNKRFFPKKGKCFYRISGEGSKRVGHLDHLVVGMFSRKSGIGSALLKKTVEMMKKEGAKKIVLEVHSIQSDAMKKMVKREGFKLVGYKEIPSVNPWEHEGMPLPPSLRRPVYEKKL